MLVGKRMSHPVITIPADMSVVDALNLMKREHIRRAPVVKDGKMVGMVADKDLLNASASPATSLSVWELNYLLSKITVQEVMNKKVISITEDTPIEEAARIMADNKIGGMPVVRGDEVVGMITETDLFKLLLELMGAHEPGVRVTAYIPEQRGSLANITAAIAAKGGNFISYGAVPGESQSNRLATFKVAGIDEKDMRQILDDLKLRVTDIRVQK